MPAPKILSVDDSKMIHTLINKAFSPYNANLCFASNGVEGLAAASRENPDLIILDVTMPVMDGVECLMKLKSDPSLKDTPVIMLTAEAGKENVLKIAKMGVRDYVVKPFTEQNLIDRASRIIELKPKGSEAGAKKNIFDPIHLIIIDEHPNIIETIKGSLSELPWKISGSQQINDAAQVLTKEPPDAVIVSLSLPNKAAAGFFQMIRSNPRTQTIPVLGLSVKTALEEQTDAKNMGFSGIITKPIDAAELPDRLCRFMGLDTSERYFKTQGDVLVINIPKNFSVNGASDLAQYLEPKTKGLVEAGMNKVVVDFTQVPSLEIFMIKMIMTILSTCRELDLKARMAASEDFISQAKQYEETSHLQVFPSVEKAIADLG